MRSYQNAELKRSCRLLYGNGQPHSDVKAAQGAAGEAAAEQYALYRLLRRSGLSVGGAKNYTLRSALELAALVMLGVIAFGAGGVILGAVPAALEYLRLKRCVQLRAQEFEGDYTALLLSLASGVRTGLDPLVALHECAALFPESSLVRREIEVLSERISRGASEQEAILNFAATVEHPDICLFRTSFLLARREGSSLAPCLQRLGRVTRQRQSFRRKARAAVAMQKLSAVGIAVCACVIGMIQLLTNAHALHEALLHPVGRKVMIGGIFLILAGLVWMTQISRARA